MVNGYPFKALQVLSMSNGYDRHEIISASTISYVNYNDHWTMLNGQWVPILGPTCSFHV